MTSKIDSRLTNHGLFPKASRKSVKRLFPGNHEESLQMTMRRVTQEVRGEIVKAVREADEHKF